tara:strand:- start:466 stop:588 length:123 start_codon:yes stop_codon:yes gene_type:complete
MQGQLPITQQDVIIFTLHRCDMRRGKAKMTICRIFVALSH